MKKVVLLMFLFFHGFFIFAVDADEQQYEIPSSFMEIGTANFQLIYDTEYNEFEYSGITQIATKIPIIKKSYEKKINLTYLGINMDSIMTSDVLFSNIGVFVGGQSMYIDSPISEGSYTSLYWGWEVPLFNMPRFSGTNVEIIGFWEVPTVSFLVGRFVKTNFFDFRKELSNYSLYFYMKNTLSYFDATISYSVGIGVGTGLYF